ncbi:hypothetical protein L1987_65632 [Smallanthus sonchifolius]|uniref:Uncharacterized protein n=1 Tax=Smallanthus sonchifolius TaxID=185202 RepID=A0ACB9BUV0_9ASTR|nr:hypothetical protein L1987_65632 [Smallanthus sonchifolius]
MIMQEQREKERREMLEYHQREQRDILAAKVWKSHITCDHIGCHSITKLVFINNQDTCSHSLISLGHGIFEEKYLKMGYWKSTVVPKFKKLFEKNSVKKAGAAEACKTFDGAKEDYSKEFEEKKTELQVKVLEIYEASSAEIKTAVKERKEGALKKVSSAVEKFLEELSKIEFPGSKQAHEACCKFGPTYVEGPIFFVFEKVSTFIVVEEKKEEEAKPEAAAPVEETSTKEKEIVLEEEKKEEVTVAAEVEKTPEPEAAKPEVEKTPKPEVAKTEVEKTPEPEAAKPEAAKVEEVAPTEPPKAC